MNYTIPLTEALKLAAQRRAERLAGIQADLGDLRTAGCEVAITAAQLLQLEDADLLYDFDSGLCEDFTLVKQRQAQQVVQATLTARTDVYATMKELRDGYPSHV